MRFDAIIFDFDGVLLESEFKLNKVTADVLTELGHEVTVDEAVRNFTGLSGREVLHAIEAHIGADIPAQFHDRMRQASFEALEQGIDAIAGAVEFVQALPDGIGKAVASSSSTAWIRGHLEHLGLAEAFGEHVYSGREHVGRGKPAPDIYLYAARQLGVPIDACVILEDSRVGATGALASGATVIGLAAGRHCFDGHAEMLRKVGVRDVAHNFDEVAQLVGLSATKD